MTTMSDAQAAAAILAHHHEMDDELRRRVSALLAAVGQGTAHAEHQRRVLEYLEEQVVPHAAAEESALYPAGDKGATQMLLRAMRAEHVNLIGHVADLRGTTDGVTAVATAAAILALFEAHLYKENELLVPALVADPDISLAILLEGMHELLG